MNNNKEKQWPLFRSFQGVGLSDVLRFDLVAGLTLAAIAIPTKMATARLGGFAPDVGFFAFIAGTTAFAAFGSNRFLSAAVIHDHADLRGLAGVAGSRRLGGLLRTRRDARFVGRLDFAAGRRVSGGLGGRSSVHSGRDRVSRGHRHRTTTNKNHGRCSARFKALGLALFRFDLAAGLTLAAIVIPTQMATARLALPLDIGFFAFIAGLVAFAALGSNRFLSAGADFTIMPIFAGSLALLAPVGFADYSELAAALALLVGLILLLAGVFRAGWVADLLSIPVVTGFLAGIAIHIAISQAPGLLGLPGGEGEVFHRLALLGHDIGKTNFLTLAIGASCLACIVIFEKISPRIPGALIALAGATFVVAHFDLEAKGVAVIGAFNFAPPHPAIPIPSLDDLAHVIGLAAIISVIIMVQTAATSRSFPGAPGEAPDVDRDFVGVGAGSALAGLFGAFPVDASPPSTAIVAAGGARSQFAGLVACAVVAAVAAYGAELLAMCRRRRWRPCCCSSPRGFSACRTCSTSEASRKPNSRWWSPPCWGWCFYRCRSASRWRSCCR